LRVRFVELPAQAVVFSLSGIEILAGYPYIKRHLERQLKSKTYCVEIISSKKQYDSDIQPPIKIVIYDKSSNIKVNLNSVILNAVCQDMDKNIPKVDENDNVNRKRREWCRYQCTILLSSDMA
jgi:hypothetical protein